MALDTSQPGRVEPSAASRTGLGPAQACLGVTLLQETLVPCSTVLWGCWASRAGLVRSWGVQFHPLAPRAAVLNLWASTPFGVE